MQTETATLEDLVRFQALAAYNRLAPVALASLWGRTCDHMDAMCEAPTLPCRPVRMPEVEVGQ